MTEGDRASAGDPRGAGRGKPQGMNLDRRLILVVGKGGVGRSTVAAAIAGQCAAQGKKTLLYETSANDRFGDYFGRPPVGDTPSQLAPNLWEIGRAHV